MASADQLLQRKAGNRYVGRLLQRRIGFEWEVGTQRPWLVKPGARPVAPSEPETMSEGEPSSEDDDGFEWVLPVPHTVLIARPVPRKGRIHETSNRDWRIEADDSPGPRRSNVEYVTEPFEDTAEGIERFRTAIGQIDETVKSLAWIEGKPGPGGVGTNDTNEERRLESIGVDGLPPYTVQIFDDDEDEETLFATPARHKLSGGEGAPPGELRMAAFGRGGKGKMQATFGSDLGSLGAIMALLGAQGPTVGQGPVVKGDTRLVGPGFKEHPGFKFLDAAPKIATAVVDDLVQESGSGVTRLERTDKLHGFLSAVALAILCLGGNRDDLMKYRFVLMPRTSHAVLFASLPQAQALTGKGSTVSASLVKAINTSGLLRIDDTSPLLADVPDATSLTVGRWVKGIVDEATDYIVPSRLDPFLQQAGVDEDRRKKVGDKLESFGTVLEGDSRAGETADELLAVFEHRGIDPFNTSGKGGQAPISIEEAKVVGDAMMTFLSNVRALPDAKPEWPRTPGTT